MNDVQQGAGTPSTAAQQCSQCGAAIAPDQRYCLNCGNRVAAPRTGPPESAAPAVATERVAVRSEPRQSDFSPLAAVLGIALLGGMLLIGVLIGRGESDDEQQPPVVQLEEATTPTGQSGAPNQRPSPPAAGQGESQAAAEIVSEWPAGTEGFTVRLTSTPKQGATPEGVETLRSDAESKGLSTVGVLDSDLYASLPPSEWVVYSGIYANRSDAEKAVSGVRADYPGASAIEVSTTQASSTQRKLEPSEDAGAVVSPTDTGARAPALSDNRAPSDARG